MTLIQKLFKSPLALLLGGILFTLILFIGMGGLILDLSHQYTQNVKAETKLLSWIGDIIHLDEVLSMSTKMAVSTGDLKWEERYLSHEPKLDQAIKNVIAMAPEAFEQQAAQQTNQANLKLVAMETQAFELLRQGKQEEAYQLLFSTAYDEQKSIYMKGMEQNLSTLNLRIKGHLEKFQQKLFLAGILTLINITMLLLCWIGIWIQIKRYLAERAVIMTDLQKAKEAAEVANNAKSEFLANMSHELRTPMMGILGFSSRGIRKVGAMNVEELKGYFQHVHSSGERLMFLLNALLDTSKLESGKMDYHFHSNDLIRAIHLVIKEFEVILNNHLLTVQVSAASEEVLAYFDSNKIVQVIRNILHNAIKFTPDGKRISISLEENVTTVSCTIWNEGDNLPENELEEVFDKFVQSSKTKTNSGGTGLGLSICQSIILDHHGKIWAENAPQGGPLFHFTLMKNRKAYESAQQ